MDIGPVNEADPDQTPSATVMDSYPRLKHLQPHLSQDRSYATFAESLEVLTDHLEALGKR